MTATPLAPIRKTQMNRRIICGGRGLTGRAECWGAETLDGAWILDREESSGTPWITRHRETRTDVGLHGTLRQARVFVASGEAQKELDRLLAHERGEHATDRNPSCGRC